VQNNAWTCLKKGENMMTIKEIKKSASLEDVKINIKLKLSALWTAAMFCYLYADVPGHMRSDLLAVFLIIIEVVLTALIVLYAWKWSKQEA